MPQQGRAERLLALADPEPGEMQAVAAEVWSWAFGLAGHGGGSTGSGASGSAALPLEDSMLREAVLETSMKAALGTSEWSSRSPTARLALVEERLLARFGAADFRATNELGQSFLSWLSRREDVTAALFQAEELPERPAQEVQEGSGGAGRGAAHAAWLEAEATRELRQVREMSSAEVGAEDLARLLWAQWRVASPTALEPLARAVLEARGGSAEEPAAGAAGWGGGAVLSAGAALWEPGAHSRGAGGGLARGVQGAEALARAALRAAPSLEDLAEWLCWDAAFAPTLGELHGFLRSAAPGLGILAFDAGGGRFFKVGAAAAAYGAWEAAITPVCRNGRSAAEALLAGVHTCGADGLPPRFWRAYSDAVAVPTEEGDVEERAAVAAFLAELLGALPDPFCASRLLLAGLLRPVSAMAEELLEASWGSPRARRALQTAGLLLRVEAWTSDLERCLAGESEGPDEDACALLPEVCDAPPAPPMPDLVLLGGSGPAGAAVKDEVVDDCPGGRREGENCAPVPLGGPQSAGLLLVPGEGAPASGLSALAFAARLRAGAPAHGGAFPGGEEAARALVEHIRREEFGIEGPLASEVSGLRRRQNARLARALARLGEQLYADSYHWQLELLQNADDCDYAQGVEPHVEFVVGPGSEVIVRTNELGVTPEDVCSLCDIGNSTKPTRRAGGGAHIGEKGLGFKAVFAVSDRPQLFSGPVAIAFDAAHPSGLGYILPEWLSDDVSRSGAGATGSNGWTTSLVLPLRQALRCRVADVARRLGELPAATLLFLRRVRRIAVVSEAGHPAHSCLRLALARPRAPTPLQDAEEATVVVEANGERRHERWLVVQLRVPVPDGVERPGGSTPHTTFLEAACPLTSSGAFDAERGPQPVFAHLPVGPPLGSAVALQGDWALASSREALLEGHPWNDLLLAALPDLLQRLVGACRARGGALAQGCLAAVPDPAAVLPPFRAPMVELGRRLREAGCVLTSAGDWAQPSATLLVGRRGVRELLQSPASPLGRAAPAGLHLVDAGVELLVPARLLESLGCRPLGARHLCQLLEAYAPGAGPAGAAAHAGTEAWWRRFLAVLDDLLDASPDEEALLLPRFRRLAFLPVCGGGVAACAEGLCLPAEPSLAHAVPPTLLAAMRVLRPALVDPQVIEIQDDEGEAAARPPARDGAGGDLAAARARRVLRRLGVVPLTLGRIFSDLALPAFARASAAARAARAPLPATLPASATGLAPEVLRALAALLVARWGDFEAEHGGGPVAWPLVDGPGGTGEGGVAVGVPRRSPPLHLPSVQLREILEGSSVPLQVPFLPPGPEAAAVLRRSGLALPVLRLCCDESGDWSCPEFEKLVYAQIADSPNGRPPPTAEPHFRSLALAFDEHWAAYEEFARASGGLSAGCSFLQALRLQSWMPASDGSLRPPGELCARTAAIAAAFPDGAAEELLACSVSLQSRSFCTALGVQLEPCAALAARLLRSWSASGCAGVTPPGAAGAYALLEAEAGEAVLRSFPSVVVEKGRPLLLPEECVWEDPAGCGGSPAALAPLYGPRWRRLFTEGLGVRAEPSLEQCARALGQLAAGLGRGAPGSGGGLADTPTAACIHRMLLHLGEGAARGVWTTQALGDVLHRREVLPLRRGGLGAPQDGLLWLDDCPDAPPAWLAGSIAEALLAEPAQLPEAGASWRLLLDSVGVCAVSAACSFRACCVGASESAALTARVHGLLPLAERYVRSRHPELHVDLRPRASRLAGLRVLVAIEVFVECALAGSQPTTWARDVAVTDGASDGGGGLEMYVQVGAEIPWPAICLGLARAVVPPGPAPRAASREGLATLLLSAHAVAAGDASSMESARLEELCATFSLPPVPAADGWGLGGTAAAEARPRRAAAAAAPPKTEPDGGLPTLADPYGGSLNDPGRPVKLEADPAAARRGGPDGRAEPGRAAARARRRHAPSSSDGSGSEATPPPGPRRAILRPAKRHRREGDGGSGGLWPLAAARGHAGACPEGHAGASLPERVFTEGVVGIPSEGLRALREALPQLPPVAAGSPAEEELAAVGRWGERFVCAYLRQALSRAGGAEAARRVVWVNSPVEAGMPYDIRVDDEEGLPAAYVEVKSTRTQGRHLFEMSFEEWAFAKRKGAKYAVYRVFDAGRPSVRLAAIPDPHLQWRERRIGVCIGL